MGVGDDDDYDGEDEGGRASSIIRSPRVPPRVRGPKLLKFC